MPTIIKSTRIREADGSGATRASGAARSTPAAPSCEKTVEVLRLEGVVHAIHVTCSCGEVSVVELTYPDASAVPDRSLCANPEIPQCPSDP
jgi:hypothetical protein